MLAREYNELIYYTRIICFLHESFKNINQVYIDYYNAEIIKKLIQCHLICSR